MQRRERGIAVESGDLRQCLTGAWDLTAVLRLNAGSGRNTATADKFPRCVVPRRFDFGFTTALLYKDIKLCLDEAEALGVPMIVGNAVRQMMGIGKATMGPDADITEFVKPIEQWAGVEVGKKA